MKKPIIAVLGIVALFGLAFAPSVYASGSHEWSVEITGFLTSSFVGLGTHKGRVIEDTGVTVKVDSADSFLTSHPLICGGGPRDLITTGLIGEVRVNQNKAEFDVRFAEFIETGGGNPNKGGCEEDFRIHTHIDKVTGDNDGIRISHFGCQPSGAPKGRPIVCHDEFMAFTGENVVIGVEDLG